MQVALTKKLAEAMDEKPGSTKEAVDPLFMWTANWINTFQNRKEDMIVMVNHETLFTVIIYGIKRRRFKDIRAKMLTAIRNTLNAMHVNPEVIDEYLMLSGEVEFVANHDRKLAARITRQGLSAALVVGEAVNEAHGEIKYEDTLGYIVSRGVINVSSKNENSFTPTEVMMKALADLTNKSVYQYRAFELLVTLDLDIYQATRRLIVPADLKFTQLHKVLQSIYNWKNYHMYDFTVFADDTAKQIACLVSSEEALMGDNDKLVSEYKLSEYFPEYKQILYTYDFGDNWEHEIKLVRVIEEHDEQSPFLLEATGQAPPEDVGGVVGYLGFREIMLDPEHQEHQQMKEWVGYWTPELSEWNCRPHLIDL